MEDVVKVVAILVSALLAFGVGDYFVLRVFKNDTAALIVGAVLGVITLLAGFSVL